MNRNTLQFSVAALLLLILTVALLRQRQSTERLEKEVVALRSQIEKIAPLEKDNHRLADQLKAVLQNSQAETLELARLRGQAGRVVQIERENINLKAERQRDGSQSTQPETKEENPYDKLLGTGSGLRMQHAMRWGHAVHEYARQHEGQFPANLKDALMMLGPDGLTAEEKAQTALTLDQYELLYHGRLDEMTNPPPEGAIILRSKAWQTDKGTWARTYIRGDGLGQMQVEPDGNFEKWESIRLSKPNAR